MCVCALCHWNVTIFLLKAGQGLIIMMESRVGFLVLVVVWVGSLICRGWKILQPRKNGKHNIWMKMKKESNIVRSSEGIPVVPVSAKRPSV